MIRFLITYDIPHDPPAFDRHYHEVLACRTSSATRCTGRRGRSAGWPTTKLVHNV